MIRTLTIAAFAVAFCSVTYAEDLGVKAQTYAPDPDARDQIKDVIRKKEADGELADFWQKYRDKTIDSIMHPPSLGISSDYTPHSELRNLRFVLPRDYRDQNGVVIARKGTVIEPLKIQPLTYGLIFIDGTDPKQVAYAVDRSQKELLKIVLTAGSYYALRVKYKNVPWHGGIGVPFYYDQRKMIINQLHMLYGIDINSVPVELSQEGQQLRIAYGIKDDK